EEHPTKRDVIKTITKYVAFILLLLILDEPI
ncbi:MAG: hypothetical protein RLZ33_978, partial [Bacteroidota bacterium]